jgi:transposase
MSLRTRRWEHVAQEARRLAGLGQSAKQIGLLLDVDRSTVQRWMRAGKIANTLTDPRGRPRRAGQVARVTVASAVPVVAALQTPAEWAATIRREYRLDATDDQLVTLAQRALETAQNPDEVSALAYTAMARFQALVKQLALPTKRPDLQQQPAAPAARREVPARSGEDPRARLMAAS